MFSNNSHEPCSKGGEGNLRFGVDDNYDDVNNNIIKIYDGGLELSYQIINNPPDKTCDNNICKLFICIFHSMIP